MEHKNATRMSVVERNQAETDRKLEDVMQSNLDLKNLLKTVITSLTGNEVAVDRRAIQQVESVHSETSWSGGINARNKETIPDDVVAQEQWWDLLCRASDDEDGRDVGRECNRLNRNETRD